MCQFFVCYSNIYNLYMYKHETIRNRLIGYLKFIPVNWNLETADQLTGYSVKVHSTSAMWFMAIIFINQHRCS